MAAILGGGFIAVITMLYGTIANVIEIVGFKQTDHPLVENDSEANKAKRENNSKSSKEEQERKEKVKKAEEEVKNNQ
jgi:uncharacterized membrane protein (DUF106 family)